MEAPEYIFGYVAKFLCLGRPKHTYYVFAHTPEFGYEERCRSPGDPTVRQDMKGLLPVRKTLHNSRKCGTSGTSGYGVQVSWNTREENSRRPWTNKEMNLYMTTYGEGSIRSPR